MFTTSIVGSRSTINNMEKRHLSKHKHVYFRDGKNMNIV